MKLRMLIVLSIFTFVSTVACGFTVNLGPRERGSGQIITEEREVSGFDEVILMGSGKLYIEQGDEEGLTIEADDNLMRYLTSEVHGTTLELGQTPNIRVIFSRPAIYTLRVKNLEAIKLSGSGEVKADSIKADSLALDTLGSGDFDLDNLQVKSLSISNSGSGDYTLAGVAEDVTISILGSGKLNTADLQAQHMSVSISGSGDVTVRVEETLDVNIIGSGDVKYYGSPDISQSIAASGKLQKLGD